MRISDWSSDVCSSDLLNEGLRHHRHAEIKGTGDQQNQPHRLAERLVKHRLIGLHSRVGRKSNVIQRGNEARHEYLRQEQCFGIEAKFMRTQHPSAYQDIRLALYHDQELRTQQRCAEPNHAASAPERSEEHTSELQSLMRITYAV